MFSFILKLLQVLISSKPTWGNLKRGMNVYIVNNNRPYEIATSFIIDRKINFVKCRVEYLIEFGGGRQIHTFHIEKYNLGTNYYNGMFANRETAFQFRDNITSTSNHRLRRKIKCYGPTPPYYIDFVHTIF
jgi:hypothetical protein